MRIAIAYLMYIRSICENQEHRKDPVNKKAEKKSNKKNSQLVLRLDKDERDAFVQLCNDMDTSAAREIRGFIRKFLKENQTH